MKWPGVVALTGLALASALAQEPAPPKAAGPPPDILSRRIVLGRAAGDVRSLIDHVRANSAALHVDPDRLALWGFSGGGALLGVAFQQRTPFVRCVVSYYGILDLREPAGSGMPPAVPEPVASELSPVYLVAHSAGPFPPTLIARAGRDNPRINQSVDDFVRAAVTRDVSLDLLTLPQGQHAFDVLDDTPRSREVIERTVAYLRANLERASSAKQQ